MAGEIGYCMKCKEKVAIKSGKPVVWKNGTHAIEGKCPHCGTKVCRAMGK